jgi:hypothetical protein
MLLINPNFMDNLLDKGLKGRYTNNSSVFITDLKNLLFGKNRLKVGKFLEDNICIEDTQMDRVNSLFNEYSNDFDIEEDWNKLVSARNLARNIQDKIFLEEKLTEDSIKYVYWLGPNKTDEHTEDIVIETIDDKQYSVNINKKINLTKTQSFNTILNTLFGKVDSLYSEDVMLPKWDKLTREWVKLIYNNAKPNIKSHIKKFIDPERIESLTYFGYFDIKHSDKRFENLGELIPELNKNILELSDLLGEIWKQREICLENLDVITKEWDEKKKEHRDIHEPTRISAGDLIQWNEQNKCITITREGETLYWEGMHVKKLVSWIHSEAQFENWVMTLAQTACLEVEKISGERYPTFRFR